MLGNLTGWHIAVIVGVVVVALVAICLFAWLVAFFVRRAGRREEEGGRGPDADRRSR